MLPVRASQAVPLSAKSPAPATRGSCRFRCVCGFDWQLILLEVKKVMGNDYSFMLTAAGRALASARIEVCQYVGPAPVSLRQYERVVRAQAARIQLTPESLRKAFSDLVLPDELLSQLGPS